MQALDLVHRWPVDHVSVAAIVAPRSGDATGADTTRVVATIGESNRSYRLASVAKTITTWAVLVAVEEGLLALDSPLGQPGCTLRHLLSHAGGYPFDGDEPIAAPGRRRIYSNTGIELAAAAVAAGADMPFADYIREAVTEPLGMSATELRGSPAHGIWSTSADMVRFLLETITPSLISAATAAEACQPVFADLPGIVPGVGRYDRCSWGLGFELKGDKNPHWTGTRNSPETFGHFGGAGTFVWVDLGAAHDRAVACVALTNRPFDEWAPEALQLWPALSDAVLAEALG